MPPVILWILGAAGVAVMAKWLVKESRRINDELDASKAQSVHEPAHSRANLKRDPETGVYRPR
jgi:hypothetical protein